MATKRYYIAYGSNLNVPQMKMRCPGAKIVGTAVLKDYELLFKGSMTGSYLTIESKEGSEVPVAIWSVTEFDEARLDRYEGFPRFYYKKENILLNCHKIGGGNIPIYGFAYIMWENHRLGIPTDHYMRICSDGYETFYFDKRYLIEAYERSVS